MYHDIRTGGTQTEASSKTPKCTTTSEEQTFFQKFKSHPSKVDKTHKLVLRHFEDRGVNEKEWRTKESCQTGHLEEESRGISYPLLEDREWSTIL